MYRGQSRRARQGGFTGPFGCVFCVLQRSQSPAASDSAGVPRDLRLRSSGRFRQDVQEALEGVSFIAQHMKSDDLDQSVSC